MEKIRMLHIRLPEEMHRKIRFICADRDIAIQTYVIELIQKDLENFKRKEGLVKNLEALFNLKTGGEENEK